MASRNGPAPLAMPDGLPSVALTEAEAIEMFERLASLEMALEAQGWRVLSADADNEFSRAGLRDITQFARVMAIKNPLIKRGVQVQRLYVFGQDFNVTAETEEIDDLLTEFYDDPRNLAELTSHQAIGQKETELQTDGNLFFVFFTNQVTGRVRVRSIPFDEVEDRIANPDDGREPWYYLRRWTDTRMGADGVPVLTAMRAYYPDWRYTPTARPAAFGDVPIHWERPIFHVRVGGYGNWKFGLSEVYDAIDWARAYKEFLEDWASIVRAYRKFAFALTTPGGKNALSAAKAKLGGTLGDGTAASVNMPPAVGSTFIAGPDVSLQPVRTSGATVGAEDGRRLLLMVAASFGLPECYSDDTEVMTESGFMRHDEWTEGTRVACYNPETGVAEFHQPNELRRYYYNGDMIHFKSAQADILVTPNHRMWTAPTVQWEPMPATGKIVTEAFGPGGRQRIADGAPATVNRDWRIETAEHILANPRDAGWRFKCSFKVQEEIGETCATPVGEASMAMWARFLGYWIAEGCATESTCKSGEFRKDGSPIMRTFRRIFVSQHEGAVLEDMRATLDALGIHYHTTVNQRGVVSLVIIHKALWEYLRRECGKGSYTKRIPSAMLRADVESRRALFDALMAGDGGESGSSHRYSTASRQLADDMQQLSLSLGYGASVALEKSKDGWEIYRVWIRSAITEEVGIRPKHVTKEEYSGFVYCFNLPYGIYVTRRNGKIAIQGNTYFGDASVGTLATAQSLDRPTELKMIDRQTLWTDVLRAIHDYVLLWGVKAAQGPLRGLGRVVATVEDGQIVETLEWNEGVEEHVAITFPPIVTDDMAAEVAAIVQAATLGGAPLAGTVELPQLAGMLFSALGVKESDEILAAMFPDGQVPEPEEPALTIPSGEPEPEGEPPALPAQPGPGMAEALMIKAVRELRGALVKLQG